MYIQGMGWPIAQPSARVRRTLGAGATLLFELDGAHLAYAAASTRSATSRWRGG